MTIQLAKNSEPKETAKTAISLKNVNFSYADHPATLKDINLTIFPGERVGIIGHNGAGKTTLFLSICGILAVTGEISLFDKPVIPGEFRSEIGLVFQNPNDQLFCASVWEDVAFGPENMGLTPAEVNQRVERALTITGVQELASRPPHHLSGGEKRMVAIAGVLAMQPQLIIYDEPSANLDALARRRLIQFLQATSETMLISSHDLEMILEVCDRVILMVGGKIVADGMPAKIMGNQQLMTSFGLEKPYSLQHFSD